MVEQFWHAGIIWGFLSEKITLRNERENSLLLGWINWKCLMKLIYYVYNVTNNLHFIVTWNLVMISITGVFIYIYAFPFSLFRWVFCLFVCFCFLFLIWFGSFWLWIFSWMKRSIWNYLVIIILRAMDCHDVS